jgi:uncharacterized protein
LSARLPLRGVGMELSSADLHDFARGAAFLGTGGGGDPYTGRLLVQQELQHRRRVTIIDPSQLDDDALVIPVATMGAPSVTVERFPRVESILAAMRALEDLLGRKAAAVMPIEVGGINSTLPLVVGARTGLPVVDADGMGRAFPELQMMTFGIYGCSASPVVLTDDHENSVIVQTRDNRHAEKFARNAVVAMGGGAHIALYPMTGRQIKQHAVWNTLRLALEIGRAIGAARRGKVDPVQGLVEYFHNRSERRTCRVLFDGKICDLSREMRGGFSVGRVMIEGLGATPGQLEVVFQNENLAARRAGRIVALVPDLICILDSDTAEPITTEALKYGQRVKVVGVSVPPIMRTNAALQTFGPQAFGLAEPYVPLEEIEA